MLRNLSEKLGAKFLSTILAYSFSGILQLETIPVEGQQLNQKDKKRRKRKDAINKLIKKRKDVGRRHS